MPIERAPDRTRTDTGRILSPYRIFLERSNWPDVSIQRFRVSRLVDAPIRHFPEIIIFG